MTVALTVFLGSIENAHSRNGINLTTDRPMEAHRQTPKATQVMSVEMLWKLCGNEARKTNCLPGIAVKTDEPE